MQCEISIEGRLIITLEEGHNKLKIWYNDYKKEVEDDVDEGISSPVKNPLSPFQPMGDEKESPTHKQQIKNKKKKNIKKGEFQFKSLKDLDEFVDNEEESEDSIGTEEPLELEYYLLLSHKSKITNFKILMPDLYEGFKHAIPTVIATITEKGWIFLWYENLMDQNISFMCAHVFKPNHNDIINDICFLEYPVMHPERYHELKEKHSYIFNPEKNKIAQIKKSHNNLGVYQNSFEETTYDWIYLLKDKKLEIYRAEGLRNFPIKHINVTLKSEISMKLKMTPRLHQPHKLFSISIRDFNDKISFYGINKSLQLVKYRKDLHQKASRSEWHFRNVLIAKRDYITDVQIHPDYPLLVNKKITNELWFYFEEQTVRDIVKYNNLKFIGQYNHDKEIKQLCFIDKIPGVILLNQNNSITIVCCDTFLKVLGSHQFSKEFLDIWDTKKNNAYEKWVLVDEYSLIEDITDVTVHSIQILSTHFEQSEATIKIMIFFEKFYSIMDIKILISSFIIILTD